MRKWVGIIGGLAASVGGIRLIVIFAPQVLVFLEGIGGIVIVIAGLLILATGVSELRNW